LSKRKQGDLLTAFFGGTREGHPDVCIYLSRKNKGSKSWTAPVKVAEGLQPDGSRKACYNPVLFEDEEGVVHLFYKVGSRVSDWKGFLISSRDGGHSWSRPYPLPEGYLGPIKNKPVQLAGGRVIAPSSTEGDGWKVHFEISEAGGRKIHKVGPIAGAPSVPTHLRVPGAADQAADIEGGDNRVTSTVQAIQPSILIHKDGRLQILCRTRNGRVGTSWSTDNGETWSPVELTSLPNNNSGTDAVTLADGRHLIVYNAVATPDGEKKGVRTPLNVAVSPDGINWQMVMTLEDSPVSQYSYPSVIQGKDGRIHVVYTWRRQRIKYMEIKL
jgi:alpha-L-rhamnosidase